MDKPTLNRISSTQLPPAPNTSSAQDLSTQPPASRVPLTNSYVEGSGSTKASLQLDAGLLHHEGWMLPPQDFAPLKGLKPLDLIETAAAAKIIQDLQSNNYKDDNDFKKAISELAELSCRSKEVEEQANRVKNKLLLSSIEAGNHDRTLYLLENKSSPNVVNEFGETAVMLAIQHGQKNIIKLLLSRGADMFRLTPNNKGVTTYWLENKDPEIIRILHEHCFQPPDFSSLIAHEKNKPETRSKYMRDEHIIFNVIAAELKKSLNSFITQEAASSTSPNNKETRNIKYKNAIERYIDAIEQLESISYPGAITTNLQDLLHLKEDDAFNSALTIILNATDSLIASTTRIPSIARIATHRIYHHSNSVKIIINRILEIAASNNRIDILQKTLIQHYINIFRNIPKDEIHHYLERPMEAWGQVIDHALNYDNPSIIEFAAHFNIYGRLDLNSEIYGTHMEINDIESLLLYSASHNAPSCTLTLLKNFTDIKVDITIRPQDDDDRDELDYELEASFYYKLDLKIKSLTRIRLAEYFEQYTPSIATFAALNGHLEILEYLDKNGYDFEKNLDYKSYLINLFTLSGNIAQIDKAITLIHGDSDIFNEKTDISPLGMAVILGRDDVFKWAWNRYLTAHSNTQHTSVNLSTSTGNLLQTDPLSLAVISGHKDLAINTISPLYSIPNYSPGRPNALLYALYLGAHEIAKHLFKRGWNLPELDCKRLNAFECATFADTKPDFEQHDNEDIDYDFHHNTSKYSSYIKNVRKTLEAGLSKEAKGLYNEYDLEKRLRIFNGRAPITMEEKVSSKSHTFNIDDINNAFQDAIPEENLRPSLLENLLNHDDEDLTRLFLDSTRILDEKSFIEIIDKHLHSSEELTNRFLKTLLNQRGIYDAVLMKNFENRTESLAFSAINSGHTTTLNILLETNYYNEKSRASDEATLACRIAECGGVEMLRLLISNNHDVSIPGSNGITPLMIAARDGNRDLATTILTYYKEKYKDMNELLEKIDAQNAQGLSALDFALRTEETRTEKLDSTPDASIADSIENSSPFVSELLRTLREEILKEVDIKPGGGESEILYELSSDEELEIERIMRDYP